MGSRSSAPPRVTGTRVSVHTSPSLRAFGGRPAEEVLSKIVEHAQEESEYFKIWGRELVDTWLESLRPGQRVPLDVSRGVATSLRGVEYSTYSYGNTMYRASLTVVSDLQSRDIARL